MWLFWACAVVLTPWVVFLFVTQVPRAEAHQIGPLAAGLILAMIVGLSADGVDVPPGFPAVGHGRLVHRRGHLHLGLVPDPDPDGRYALGRRGAGIPGRVAVVIVGLCVLVIRRDFSARPSPPARWLPIVLAVAALALVPTLVVVLTVIPAVQTAHHLKIAWTGLDVFEVRGPGRHGTGPAAPVGPAPPYRRRSPAPCSSATPGSTSSPPPGRPSTRRWPWPSSSFRWPGSASGSPPATPGRPGPAGPGSPVPRPQSPLEDLARPRLVRLARGPCGWPCRPG